MFAYHNVLQINVLNPDYYKTTFFALKRLTGQIGFSFPEASLVANH